MARRPKTLGELASAAGFNADSLAQIIGVDPATPKRVWHEADWLSKSGGSTLSGYAAVIPGIGDELTWSALAARRISVLDRLDRQGLALDDQALAEATEDPEIVPQYIFTALDAVSSLVDQNENEVITNLRALWGRPQSRALDVVFGANQKFSILKDTGQVIGAAEECLEAIMERTGFSFRRAVAQAHLAHQLGKLTGNVYSAPLPSRQPGPRVRQANHFFHRSSHMGALRATDDWDLVQRYAQKLSANSVAKDIELWAFPSWCGDSGSREDFGLPPSLSLRNTAVEIVSEINTYNDVYVGYLTSIFIPLALEELDPTFGGQLRKLKKALEVRAETTGMGDLRGATSRLLTTLAKEPHAVHN